MLDLSRGLEALLTPSTRDHFLKEYWEQQPLHIERRQPGFYDGVFCSQEMDRLISYSEIAYPQIDAASKAKPDLAADFMRNTFTDTSGLVGQINTAYNLYAEGCTLIVNGVERRSQAVRLMCRYLEAELSCPVAVNAYLTPAGSQGFKRHHDGHDVLVLQIEGSKHWEIYPPAFPLPYDTRTRDTAPPPPEAEKKVMDAELHAGDLLYLPRGWRHAARATDSASLHLTVGLYVYRWSQLIKEVLSNVSAADVRFRQALPPGFLREAADLQPLEVRLAELLSVLQSQADVAAAATAIARRLYLSIEPTSEGRTAEANALAQITVDTLLEKTPGMICRVVQQENSCALLLPGTEIRGPLKILPTLRFVSEQPGTFRGRQFPGLRDSEILLMLRRFVRTGLVRRAPLSG